MLSTEARHPRGVDSTRRWAWIGVVALSGLALTAPAAVRRWRRRRYERQEDWMNAYVRGCLKQNQRPS